MMTSATHLRNEVDSLQALVTLINLSKYFQMTAMEIANVNADLPCTPKDSNFVCSPGTDI